MHSSTLTTKGQVTTPKRLRDYLGLAPGDKVRFEYDEDGAIRIVPTRNTDSARDTRASRFQTLRGTRKTGMSTDEIMELLRGNSDESV